MFPDFFLNNARWWFVEPKRIALVKNIKELCWAVILPVYSVEATSSYEMEVSTEQAT
jgi:hypothetical protein